MILLGKKIFVIGASSALEKTLLNSLVEEGASIVIADKEIVNDSRFMTYKFDIFNYQEIEQYVPEIINNNGKFDGLLYSITHSDFRPLSNMSHENLLQIMNENYFSFMDFMRLFIKKKGFNDGASIIAMSSISSFKAMKAKTAFCSSKSALDAAIKCLAVEFANKGLRFNTIQKGFVQEDFSKENIQSVISINNCKDLKNQLLGITQGYEIANIVKFLFSDQTRTITGTSIVIDGGYTA